MALSPLEPGESDSASHSSGSPREQPLEPGLLKLSTGSGWCAGELKVKNIHKGSNIGIREEK